MHTMIIGGLAPAELTKILLYDSKGVEVQVDAEPAAPVEEIPDEAQKLILAELAAAIAKLEELKKPAKNKVAGKPGQVKYVLLSKTLASWGKVPQQQVDLASILSSNLEVGKPVDEAEVFDIVTRESANYASLSKSVQHPTYLLRYYRGLKHDGKHAGFVARDFLKVA